MIWLTSDTHWSHNKIIEYCDRPFVTVHEMNKALTENYNNLVKEGDICYHLGDFAFCKGIQLKAVVDSLNVKPLVIPGNHDKVERLKEAGLTIRAPFILEEIYKDKSYRLFLNHFPPGDDRCQPRRGTTHILHGHRHSRPDARKTSETSFDVGVDGQGNYSPWRLQDILKELCS